MTPASNLMESLATFNKGKALVELDEKLNDVLAAVEEHGGTGEISLKVKIKRESFKDLSVQVTATATMKKPEPEPGRGTFWIVNAANRKQLTRHDPDQLEFINEGKGKVVAIDPSKMSPAQQQVHNEGIEAAAK